MVVSRDSEFQWAKFDSTIWKENQFMPSGLRLEKGRWGVSFPDDGKFTEGIHDALQIEELAVNTIE